MLHVSFRLCTKLIPHSSARNSNALVNENVHGMSVFKTEPLNGNPPYSSSAQRVPYQSRVDRRPSQRGIRSWRKHALNSAGKNSRAFWWKSLNHHRKHSSHQQNSGCEGTSSRKNKVSKMISIQQQPKARSTNLSDVTYIDYHGSIWYPISRIFR